jgi:tRNA (guanine26-N2/guanine27-N2)-dimethyltransferase
MSQYLLCWARTTITKTKTILNRSHHHHHHHRLREQSHPRWLVSSSVLSQSQQQQQQQQQQQRQMMSNNNATSSNDTHKRKHDELLHPQENKSTDTSNTTTTSDTTNTTTIQEGSAIMTFPSTEGSTVFYNPVQVQNRDLSILMIGLYSERRQQQQRPAKQAKQQKAETRKKPESLQQQQLQPNDKETKDTQADVNGITILDALAASGLRSIRYWKEIPGVKHVTINDLDYAATERAIDNLKRNNLDHILLSDNIDRCYGICVHHGDATHEMYLSRKPPQQHQQQQQQTHHKKKKDDDIMKPSSTIQQQKPMWDVIDLDPYGSAAPFVDAAVQAIDHGGLLCITCTDMAALGGSHPETAYGRYAALPIQSAKYLQELALRILLYTIAVSAARYGRTIKPVLSVGMDFYIRVFVEIYNDKRGVTDLSLNIGNVYQSSQCSSFMVLPHGQMGGTKGNVYQSSRLTPSVCPETGATFKVGGPLWLGPLHDQEVVSLALERLSSSSEEKEKEEKKDSVVVPNMDWIATRKRLLGLLTSVSEELDTPLYYTIPGLCQSLKCTSPPNKEFKAALINAGYKVSGYHKEPTAIKTDAPDYVVWDIMRAWVEQHPLKNTPVEGSVAAKILAKTKQIEVNFTTPKKDKDDDDNNTSSNKRISRFPLNPSRHWGPKKKASGKRTDCD